MQLPGTPYVIEVKPQLPERLARLNDLANNLWYSWERGARELFARLHPALWDAVGHSPKALLRRIDERRLLLAADDPVFLNSYHRVLSAFDSYLGDPPRHAGEPLLAGDDLVAYFCAEFGFHESLPIYSGGLGILAGDHCKAASDLRLPFVAVGLLYRQGYFHQRVDATGHQEAVYGDSDFEDLPVQPVRGADGQALRLDVGLPGRRIHFDVWSARIGHCTLYLLDTNVEANAQHDRNITYRLYGGDRQLRLEQEILLGIGGVRALRALGLRPTVWHVNEGHAAFLMLERVRNLVREGLGFEAALEATAASTVFTTHTAVPAGHDHFALDMMRAHFHDYCGDVGIDASRLLALGANAGSGEFNMTSLAVRGSRYHNGVSQIHRGVAADMLGSLWPQVRAEENPVSHVTNAVHLPSFLAAEWNDVFDRYIGYDWKRRVGEPSFREAIEQIPDHIFWSMRQQLKSQMLHLVRHRVRSQHLRNQGSESHLDRLLALADPMNPNVLTIGFGRRFATYKRATLLFHDLKLLSRILSDAARPVLLLFAGKAHPADGPGQELIRQVIRVSRMPEFDGRILFVEGYDLRLARRLVSGVDVWLNNPVYPLEASGTSGMKAGINGVINLSVLDGWWGEGFDGDNGWAIKPASPALSEDERDAEEAQMLYEILQDRVLPLYYDARSSAGHSPGWMRMAKRSITSLMPTYNAERMVREYATRFYVPAARSGRRLSADGYAGARALADWKARMREHWDRVSLRGTAEAPRSVRFGERVRFAVIAAIDGLQPGDVRVEMLLGPERTESEAATHYELQPAGPGHAPGEWRYELDLEPQHSGKLEYRFRIYPCHDLLSHPFELGLMRWL